MAQYPSRALRRASTARTTTPYSRGPTILQRVKEAVSNIIPWTWIAGPEDEGSGEANLPNLRDIRESERKEVCFEPMQAYLETRRLEAAERIARPFQPPKAEQPSVENIASFPATGIQQTYQQLAKFFREKGDLPLTQEEFDRLSRIIKTCGAEKPKLLDFAPPSRQKIPSAEPIQFNWAPTEADRTLIENAVRPESKEKKPMDEEPAAKPRKKPFKVSARFDSDDDEEIPAKIKWEYEPSKPVDESIKELKSFVSSASQTTTDLIESPKKHGLSLAPEAKGTGSVLSADPVMQPSTAPAFSGFSLLASQPTLNAPKGEKRKANEEDPGEKNDTPTSNERTAPVLAFPAATEQSKPTFSFGAGNGAVPEFSFGNTSTNNFGSENTKPEAKASEDAKPLVSGDVPSGQSNPPLGLKSSNEDSTKGSNKDSTPPFSFGAAKSEDKPAFSFGAAKPESAPNSEKPAFSFGTSAFSFGSTAFDVKPSLSSKSPTLDKKETAPAFTFGDSKPIGPQPSVSFGTSKPDTSTDSKPAMVFGTAPSEAKSSEFSFGTTKPAEASAPTFAFTMPKPSETGASKPEFQFGGAVNAEEAKKPAFSFGAPKTEDPAAASKPPFTFGAASTAETKPTFAFGSTSNEQPDKPGGFTFGGGSTDTKGAAVPSTGFSLGNPAPSTQTGPGSTFTFGSTNNTQTAPTFAFGSQSQQPQPFKFNGVPGANAAAGQPKTEAMPFGASATQTPMFQFGGQPPSSIPSTSSQPAPAFSFGGGQQPPSTATFSFGGAQTQPTFSFGGASPSMAPAPPVQFPFGQPAQAAPSSFQFGASQQQQQPIEFNMGAAPDSPRSFEKRRVAVPRRGRK